MPGMAALGAKPEAAGLSHELPLSAGSGHSRDGDRASGIDLNRPLPPRQQTLRGQPLTRTHSGRRAGSRVGGGPGTLEALWHVERLGKLIADL
jgi:hypothetical protein